MTAGLRSACLRPCLAPFGDLFCPLPRIRGSYLSTTLLFASTNIAQTCVLLKRLKYKRGEQLVTNSMSGTLTESQSDLPDWSIIANNPTNSFSHTCAGTKFLLRVMDHSSKVQYKGGRTTVHLYCDSWILKMEYTVLRSAFTDV